MIRLAHHPLVDNIHTLSTLLEAPMQEFVRLVGGWDVRGKPSLSLSDVPGPLFVFLEAAWQHSLTKA